MFAIQIAKSILYLFLIDARLVAEILTELWRFQILTYFGPNDVISDVTSTKTIELGAGPSVICGSSLVMIGHFVRELPSSLQTDGQTDMYINPTNEHACQKDNFGK